MQQIEKAVSVLESRISTIHTVSEWAEEMNCSSSNYFSRVFRNHYGKRPKEVITEKKLEKVKKCILLLVIIALCASRTYSQNNTKREFETQNATQILSINLSDEYELFGLDGLSISYDAKYAILHDYQVHKIVKVDLKSGELQVLGGQEGNGPGENLGIWEVKVDKDGTIFVTDPQREIISKWDLDKGFISEFNDLGRFNRPNRIAVCPENDIVYVLSGQYWKKGLIHKFDKSMKKKGTFYKIDNKEERTSLLTDGTLSCDDKGNLYYAQMYINRIRKFDSEGILLQEREVVDFEPNKDLIRKEGRWTFRNENAKVASGDIDFLNNLLFVSFSGTKSRKYDIIDVYDYENLEYLKSIKFEKKFINFDMEGNHIVTLSKDLNEDFFLNIYTHNFFK